MRIPDFLVRFLLLLAAMSIGACELPRDGRGTLDRVRGGVMRVAVSPSEPWVKADAGQEPSGIEVDLVRGWAASLGARIEWARGAQTELAEALEHGHLDAMIAGLTTDAPWGGRLGLSQPYVETEILVAAPKGTPVPADLEGQRVAVDPARPHVAARRYLEGLDWVGTAEVRMREQGHIFFGEAFVTLRGAVSEDLPEKLERAVGGAKQLNWRLHDLVIMPVTRESMAEG